MRNSFHDHHYLRPSVEQGVGVCPWSMQRSTKTSCRSGGSLWTRYLRMKQSLLLITPTMSQYGAGREALSAYELSGRLYACARKDPRRTSNGQVAHQGTSATQCSLDTTTRLSLLSCSFISACAYSHSRQALSILREHMHLM